MARVAVAVGGVLAALGAGAAVDEPVVAGDNVAYTDGYRKLELALSDMVAASDGPKKPTSWLEPTHAPLRLFDCEAEYYDWERLWTPEWKQWCCENYRRGCPRTITVTTTGEATTTVMTTTAEPTTTTEPTTTEERTTTMVAATAPPSPCAAPCEFQGQSFSCARRMAWAFGHNVKEAEDKCRAARDLVIMQCDFCSDCPSSEGLAGTECAAEFVYKKRYDASVRLRPRGDGAPLLGIAGAAAGAAAIAAAALVLRRTLSRASGYRSMPHQ